MTVAPRTTRHVAVVGAGPAGLAVAIDLVLRGLRVTVLERRRPPLDKPCGEGLMPDGLARLRALGVEIDPDAMRPFLGICYFDGDRCALGRFSGPPGLGVRRLGLHEALVRRADQVGVDIRWGARVTGVDAETGGLSLAPSVASGCDPGTSRSMRVDFVVIADGLRSPLGRDLGLKSRPAKDGLRFGMRRHVAVEPWSPWVEVYWGDGAEAYVTPVGEREVGVAVLWNRDRIPPEEASWDRLIHGFPALRDRLTGLRPTSNVLGIGPLRQEVHSAVKGKVALVGDAAGYVDAITGEGLSIAFHEAAALAEAVDRNDLELYLRRRRGIRRLPDAMTELLLWLEPRPKLRRRVVAALEKEPEAFDRFLDVHTRRVSPWSVLPWLPRLAWRLATTGAGQ